MKHLILLTAFFSFLAQNLLAEGYQVNLQGQKQTGMGHTGTALLLGPSSVHFNPGALSLLSDQFSFSAGMSGVLSANKFVKTQPSVYEANSDNPMGTPLYFYGAAKLNEKVALGLGITTPYGNSLKWGDDWDGRYLIQDISLKAIFIQPTLSWALSPSVSIGAGPVFATGSVDLSKALPLQSASGDGQVNLTGNTTAYGFNAGLFVKLSSAINIGLNYRSKIVMEMDKGEAIFTVPSSMYENFPPQNTFSAELPMPSNFSLGLGWQVNNQWLVALDVQHVGWSAYETLNFDFEMNTPLLGDSENIRNFENTMIYRFGFEYLARNILKLRGGIYFDETPIPENYLTPETPGANKTGLSVGFSLALTDGLHLDASLLYITAEDRTDGYAPQNFYGNYSANAWIPGLGLSYSF